MAASLTCNRPTLASNRRGFAHKIAPNGVQLWRRLCSPLGVPPDDDDDETVQQYSDAPPPLTRAPNSGVVGRSLDSEPISEFTACC